MVITQGLRLLVLSVAAFSIVSALNIPVTPKAQTSRAISSLLNAIECAKQQNKPCRFYVDYLIPLPPETDAADIDPWPGGLAQMYPYAEDILTEILEGVVDEPAGKCSSQVLSQPDCCGFFVQESKTSAKNDVAAILFPSVDQLEQIDQVSQMVGQERTLILFNKQFQRPADFGFGNGDKSNKIVFDQFSYGFAFQELACRGEDTKLLFEHPKWQSYVICEEDQDAGVQEFALLPPQVDRPSYEALETKINEVLPEPLWMRKMGEVETKGFKFQRGQN